MALLDDARHPGAHLGHAHRRDPARQVGQDGLGSRRDDERGHVDGLVLRRLGVLAAASGEQGGQA
ncbi:hypothetical protein WJ968_14965 [Achromobacter xylosoxidans]